MSSSDSKKRPEPAGAQQTQRADERMPVQLRVRLKYKDVGTFIEKFALNVSRGGMFLASKQVKEIGTVLRFELQLADGQPAIKGEGRVVWNRTAESNGPQTETTGVGSNVSVGMGIKFTRVDPKSRAVLKQCLENRSKMVDRGASFPVPAHVDLDTPEAPELMDL